MFQCRGGPTPYSSVGKDGLETRRGLARCSLFAVRKYSVNTSIDSPAYLSLTYQKKRILPSLLFSWTFSIPGRADATRRKSWREGKTQHDDPCPVIPAPHPVSTFLTLLVLTWGLVLLSVLLTVPWREGAAPNFSLPCPLCLSQIWALTGLSPSRLTADHQQLCTGHADCKGPTPV